jgi:NADPH:quinone reductase-like Zn-dependent oxidoreductase
VRAVVIADGELRVEERDTPTPPPGDALVRVHGAGLNNADLIQRRGLYPAPPGWPADVPGLELSGVVESVGEGVNGTLVGRRVCAVVGGGAQATHCVVPAEHLVEVPDAVHLTEAGGFPEGATTTFDALARSARVRAGERVLISGAAGGVGSLGVQVARALGAVPIAAVRDVRHRDELMALGAAEVVTVEGVGGLEPVDVVLELVGAAHLGPALGVLAPGGRVVVIGVGGGGRLEVDLLQMMARRSWLTGSTLRSRSREEKTEIAAQLGAAISPAWSNGSLRVPVAATFALEEVESAYRLFAEPGKLGKIVLELGA